MYGGSIRRAAQYVRVTRVLVTLVALSTHSIGANAFAQSLDRDIDHYFVFAARNADLKNISVLGSCNVGVDCAQPSANSFCGVASNENVFYADGSQLAADQTRFNRPGASVWQVFTNGLSSASNVTIRHPGPRPDGTSPLAPLPILGDLDMDGTPSCRTENQDCVTDAGDLEAACGFPSTFPPCNLLSPVLVLPNQDCVIAPDVDPGNGRCDLGPGTYGDLTVQNAGMLRLVGGSYAFCSVNVGKNTVTTTGGAAVAYVNGDFSLNNGSRFGQDCRDLTLLAKGPGGFTMGRHIMVDGFYCAPERAVSLGHDSDLTGRFVGDIVKADSNVRGRCCEVANQCACFDAFSPTVVGVGDTVTLTSSCDLNGVSAVRICGIDAPITAQAASTLSVTVPAGAAGSCPIAADSSSGIFTANAPLTVS
jgi:hypothetical protein